MTEKAAPVPGRKISLGLPVVSPRTQDIDLCQSCPCNLSPFVSKHNANDISEHTVIVAKTVGHKPSE